ncbi:GCN5 family acetyltransferase [Streptomyces abyssalis]|uniref:GCN5 family acetyltransferase n=1 Tax=Streptomyces abyssalis TaxID=933944 RepID=A0A1E7JV12_9ACTN|nr:GNAT family N-acetyltransferase [Streptomyces abyssalis]OEU88953.1 GCN5 family acetyltransferase [Streptomyces abyssalis]OEU93795.1 GCN5 family acetyltransferase [Streptomyces abyssalis]OEV31239.1 GCN5 family acetyltransferase [Streptomyces nanshensis]
MQIRAGAERDLRRLQDIERAAGGVFREVGMDRIADDAPPPLPVLRRYAHHGGLWVAVDVAAGGEGEGTDFASDQPVAYVMAEPVDGNIHIEQVSVHPRSAHRRIGRALIGHVARQAEAAGVRALTLCTFAEVPWNAPYYERCGFRVLADGELTPGLRRIRAEEAHAGLDRWPRVCMRRELGAGGV